ncbi:SDR family oxidoreductase [Pseudomonas putida]|uniref:SDR family oxidoreductase n=1 Tax=Pseudomonas putida TaxID=303 RepID=UPI0039062FE8
MMRQLALEGGPHRIRAKSISPGLIETNATRDHLANDPVLRKAALNKQMLRQRIGRPKYIACAAIYPASEESSWVTGSDLTWTAAQPPDDYRNEAHVLAIDN